MGATLGSGHRVDLVNNDGVHPTQRPRSLRGQHEVQGLRGGDEDLWRVTQQLCSLRLRGVPAAHAHPNRGDVLPHRRGGARDTRQRGGEVAVNVHSQRLERRDVEHAGGRLRVDLIRRGMGEDTRARQLGERPQERRQRLTGTSGGDDQRVLPCTNGPPRLGLDNRRLVEHVPEPCGYWGMKLIQVGGGHEYIQPEALRCRP